MDLTNINVNDKIAVNGTQYRVAGFIKYQNNYSNGHTCFWYDYRLIDDRNQEAWMSITEGEENEFCLSYMTGETNPPSDCHLIEEGEQVVVDCSGDVDVEIGDKAYFKEYEDEEGDNSFSIESWNDEVEYSTGAYYDAEDAYIPYDDSNPNSYASFQSHPKQEESKKSSKKGCLIASGIGLLFMWLIGWCDNSKDSTPIAKYLEASSLYKLETQLGSGEKKAYVYKTDLEKDYVVKEIIAHVEGNTLDVSPNTDSLDNSIGLITDNEYCLIYSPEEDSTKTLVQISDREYACTSDEEPYHSNHRTRHFYHCHYYSFGFVTDRSLYGDHSKHYSNYQGSIMSKTNNAYNSYSSQYRATSSARNASTRSSSSRSHSSGGSHGGK